MFLICSWDAFQCFLNLFRLLTCPLADKIDCSSHAPHLHRQGRFEPAGNYDIYTNRYQGELDASTVQARLEDCQTNVNEFYENDVEQFQKHLADFEQDQVANFQRYFVEELPDPPVELNVFLQAKLGETLLRNTGKLACQRTGLKQTMDEIRLLMTAVTHCYEIRVPGAEYRID